MVAVRALKSLLRTRMFVRRDIAVTLDAAMRGRVLRLRHGGLDGGFARKRRLAHVVLLGVIVGQVRQIVQVCGDSRAIALERPEGVLLRLRMRIAQGHRQQCGHSSLWISAKTREFADGRCRQSPHLGGRICQ